MTNKLLKMNFLFILTFLLSNTLYAQKDEELSKPIKCSDSKMRFIAEIYQDRAYIIVNSSYDNEPYLVKLYHKARIRSTGTNVFGIVHKMRNFKLYVQEKKNKPTIRFDSHGRFAKPNPIPKCKYVSIDDLELIPAKY